MRSFADDEIIGFGGNFRSTCTILIRANKESFCKCCVPALPLIGGTPYYYILGAKQFLDNMFFTFYMCPSVPLLQKEELHKEIHSKGHQGSRYPHWHHAPRSPLKLAISHGQLLMYFTTSSSAKQYIYSQVPSRDYYIDNVFHCKQFVNEFVSQTGSVHRPKWHKFNTALRN